MSSPAEYHGLLAGSAFVRRVDRGVLSVRGADRATWLQGLVTNDVSALGTGQRVYSAYLTPQGRMISDMWVVAAADALLLDVPAPLSAALAARLDGLVFAEDVQIDDVSAAMAVVQAFTAADGAEKAAADGAAADGADDTDKATATEIEDFTYGVPSRVLYVAAADLDVLISTRLRSHIEVSLETLDVLRVEAGVPRFLVDMTEETIPLEAGIEDRAISFSKGCYVGQEIIVRVTTRGGGRVARKLVGLRFDEAAPVPPAGAPIRAGDRSVGRLTSVVRSPRCAAVIGLGYVHRDVTELGTRLEVEADGQRLAVSVHALPFVAPRA